MMRVLLVDDQADLRRLIRWSLEPLEGLDWLEARSGEQALALAREHRPGLVLLDIMMPGAIDGLEVCRRLRADLLSPPPRIVLISARGQSRDVDIGLQAGADAYLVKPFSPQHLLETVECLLVGPPSTSARSTTAATS